MSEKRETASADRYQTIPHLAGVIASGRVEDIVPFSRNVGSQSQHFVKKKQQYHAAAGEAGVWGWHQAGIGRTAYVLSNNTRYAVTDPKGISASGREEET
jgi:hypothetical protein